MSYTIREEGGKFLIVNQEGNVVGKSDARDKAERSIGYREKAEKEKGSQQQGPRI